jgi:citrate synthase
LVAKSYENLKVSRKSNIQIQIGTATTYYSDVTAKKSDQIFYDQKNLTNQSEGEIIIPKSSDKIKEIKTFINTGGAFTISGYNVEDFSKIFFDDYRFKVYKNIVSEPDREKARKQKNYYYVYDNLLNNSKNTNIIEDLKKYKQVKEQLEEFIKDPPPPPKIPPETPQGTQ